MCALVTLVAMGIVSFQLTDDALRQKLRSSAMPSWRALERATSNIDISGNQSRMSRFQDKSGKAVERERLFDFAISRRRESACQLEIRTRGSNDGALGEITVHGANERYGFELLRRPQASFELRNLKNRGDNPESDRVAEFEFMSALDSLYCACNRPLFELIDDADFRVVSLSGPDDVANDGLVTVVFNYSGVKWGFGFYPKGDYVCEMDPKQHYAVLRCRVEFPSPNKQTQMMVHSWENTTQINSEGVPLPRTIRQRRHVKHDALGDEILTTFDLPQGPTRSKEEFYLPFYGIPETVLKVVEPKPNYLRYVLIVVGALGIVVALWWGFGRRSG